MTGYAVPLRPRLIVPGPWVPTRFGIEVYRDAIEKAVMPFVDRLFRRSPREQILMMSGSDGLWLSQQIAGLVDGGTATSGIPVQTSGSWKIGLWTASIDGTMNGATTGEAAYTSYARLSLTQNTTIFAAGSTTGSPAEHNTNTWPSDAAKSWPTSTGGTATVTFMAKLNGNAGTSADKCGAWASVTSTTINSGDTPQLAQNAVSQDRD